MLIDELRERTKKCTAIIELRKMLREEGIFHVYNETPEIKTLKVMGGSICISQNGFSASSELNLLDIEGCLSKKEQKEVYCMLKFITPEEAFKRIVYCVDRDTNTYRKTNKKAIIQTKEAATNLEPEHIFELLKSIVEEKVAKEKAEKENLEKEGEQK